MKDALGEEVMQDDEQRPAHIERRVERNLVEIVDDDVEARGIERPAQRQRHREVERVAPAAAEHADAVDRLFARDAVERVREQHDLVPARRDPPEDLVQVHLGAAGLGILDVAPVDDEDAHALTLLGGLPIRGTLAAGGESRARNGGSPAAMIFS